MPRWPHQSADERRDQQRRRRLDVTSTHRTNALLELVELLGSQTDALLARESSLAVLVVRLGKSERESAEAIEL